MLLLNSDLQRVAAECCSKVIVLGTKELSSGQKRAFESGRSVFGLSASGVGGGGGIRAPRPSPSEVRDLAGQSSDPQPGAHIPHGFRWANRVSVAKQPPLFPERPVDPVKQQISDERESRAAEPIALETSFIQSRRSVDVTWL